ncbi:anti-sigma factor [Sphingobium aromaticiconvertens]|uniref:anti-sigma factor family protein n=1 Tax=Sphingobium aromaticiconvertens TaxID=365341 RepID=UPI003016FBCE
MNRISEEMLVAWCDGELDEVNRRRVDLAVADDPELAARVAVHQQLRETLAGHFAPIMEEDVPGRFAAMLTEGVVPIAEAKSDQARPARWAGWAISSGIAASLLVGLAIGRLSGGEDDGVALRSGHMVAQGVIASALDTQLASAQKGRAVQIGLSFRRKDGHWCRSFDSAAMAGVACRRGKYWRLEQLVPGSIGASDYRQAASADPRIMATIEAMVEGAPANAAQEAQAEAADWH